MGLGLEMGSLVMRAMSGVPAAFLGRQWMVAWTRVVAQEAETIVHLRSLRAPPRPWSKWKDSVLTV